MHQNAKRVKSEGEDMETSETDEKLIGKLIGATTGEIVNIHRYLQSIVLCETKFEVQVKEDLTLLLSQVEIHNDFEEQTHVARSTLKQHLQDRRKELEDIKLAQAQVMSSMDEADEHEEVTLEARMTNLLSQRRTVAKEIKTLEAKRTFEVTYTVRVDSSRVLLPIGKLVQIPQLQESIVWCITPATSEIIVDTAHESAGQVQVVPVNFSLSIRNMYKSNIISKKSSP